MTIEADLWHKIDVRRATEKSIRTTKSKTLQKKQHNYRNKIKNTNKKTMKYSRNIIRLDHSACSRAQRRFDTTHGPHAVEPGGGERRQRVCHDDAVETLLGHCVLSGAHRCTRYVVVLTRCWLVWWWPGGLWGQRVRTSNNIIVNDWKRKNTLKIHTLLSMACNNTLMTRSTSTKRSAAINSNNNFDVQRNKRGFPLFKLCCNSFLPLVSMNLTIALFIFKRLFLKTTEISIFLKKNKNKIYLESLPYNNKQTHLHNKIVILDDMFSI